MTPNQVLYRQYLLSPHWQAKRIEAFAHHGRTCNRCPAEGTEVHHKTYERLGNESMDDLEVLCPVCHGAHHRAEKAAKTPRVKRKTLHRKGLWAYMTGSMKAALMAEFNLSISSLAFGILCGDDKALLRAACVKTGVDDYYPKVVKSSKGRAKRHPNLSRKPGVTY